MKQLAFFIDVEKCIFCHSCSYACSNENQTTHKRRKVLTISNDSFIDEIHFSMSCNHCETPACMTVCSRNCIRKLRNGIVLLEAQDCNGCGKCVSVCPFQAITVDPTSKKADKCDMCYSRLQQGEQPVCVDSCIGDAIKIGNINEEYPNEYQTSLAQYSMKTITNPSTRLKYESSEKTRVWAAERGENNESTNL
ncbi:4Fe-4S dicluster domain-containing protein [Bacillus sp. B15-48]|uniref:4Fe-4S dicluster domain-containing protein n=1 Tax=Bacillus sp. B15-48 TaxID=1548601 RepID=UPI00193FC6AA|nr:4Fe-4S dicluster domain-containing protein [Bacillus sp. B15-48]